jgi:1-acyl-sn-glycerol-3-phosphate acyltransferase
VTTDKLMCLARATVTALLMTIGSLVMLAAALVTAFSWRRLYNEHIGAYFGRLALRSWGITVVAHDRPTYTGEQCVYISNHASTLDVFVLIALGLPNTRFFLSGWLRRIVPIALIGYLTGIFWTVPQDRPRERTEIFRRADRVLGRTGESVYLSPEGTRVTGGEIGRFNKGAFHLANSLGAKIVPFYILIPREVDPGRGYCARPGRIDVYFKPAIDTSGWNVGDVVSNTESVRDLYVKWHDEYRGRRDGC